MPRQEQNLPFGIVSADGKRLTAGKDATNLASSGVATTNGNGVVLGQAAMIDYIPGSSTEYSIAIGFLSYIDATACVVIGRNSGTSGGAGGGVGEIVIVGPYSSCQYPRTTLIGSNVSVTHVQGIAIGFAATSTVANQCVIGGASGADGGVDNFRVVRNDGAGNPVKLFDVVKNTGMDLGQATEGYYVAGTKVAGILETTIAPTLLNAWVNEGGAYTPAGYYKTPQGIVFIEGIIKDGTIGLPAFVVPVGYRSAFIHRFANVANSLFGKLNVVANGEVTPSAGSNLEWDISGCWRTA